MKSPADAAVVAHVHRSLQVQVPMEFWAGLPLDVHWSLAPKGWCHWAALGLVAATPSGCLLLLSMAHRGLP